MEREEREKKIYQKELENSSATDPRKDSFTTLLEKDCRLTGSFIFQGNVQVQGSIEGTCVCKGLLYIGDSAKVKGDFKAKDIVVTGHFEGSLNAEGKVSVLKEAVLRGEIAAHKIYIQEGAVVESSISLKENGMKTSEKDSVLH
jgi:cytoskeletal protein CcmA (bactofilin family)